MAAKKSKDSILRGEASPIIMIAAGVVLLLIVGASAFYAFNGGWKTAGQKDEAYKHEMMPIMAAKHGDTEALEAENNLRKARGQTPLEMPKDKKILLGNSREKLEALQKQMGAGK